jgi:amino-acid N-acetyltransferase
MTIRTEFIKPNLIPQFVNWLRSVAPYIHLFKDKIFVIAFPGKLIVEKKLEVLIHDLALLNAMGMQIVIVYGSKPQTEEQLRLRKYKNNLKNGIRISDKLVMECVKKAVGEIRLDIEAAFSSGLPNTPMGNSRIRVVSGNFLTAKPLGVHNGVDFQYTGSVRRVEKEPILQSLSKGAIVLVPPLGFSPTGEAFNLSFEDVASTVAINLGADKLIFITDEKSIPYKSRKNPIEISCKIAKKIVQKENLVEKGDLILFNAIKSCKGGVNRTHLIPLQHDGAILLELFTHAGIGALVVEENLESLRSAELDDIGAIITLIQPYEKDGTLRFRDRNTIEQEIRNFTVIEHDGVISGCASLKIHNNTHLAELGCLIVDKNFQGKGEGERLLNDAENKAKKMGIHSLFALTTIATHWFLKRGFVETTIDMLPVEKSFRTNIRGSKLLKKNLFNLD